jgi:hypothetical protein
MTKKIRHKTDECNRVPPTRTNTKIADVVTL